MHTIYENKQGVEIGTQAGDDLIKVSMDRVRLIEKSRHMFFGNQTNSADKNYQMGGTLSPSGGKKAKNALVMKAELYGDSMGVGDRIVPPSHNQ